MDVNTLRAVFGWSALINLILLIATSVMFLYARDWVYKMHGRWFPMPRDVFDVVIYCFIGAMKLVVILFNLVPYLALAIVSAR